MLKSIIFVVEAKDRRIAELEERLKTALEENERLKAEIAALKAVVATPKKHSGNSAKPPSSDIVKPPKKGKENQRGKIGAQKGHKQHLRQPFDESQVDKTIRLTLEACPKCGGELQATSEPPKKHQQVELVEKPFLVTEYQQYRYWCGHCQCYHKRKLPQEVKRAGLFGPKLISLTAYMKSSCHMSYKTLQTFYSDAISLKASTGFSAKQVRKVSEAVKAPYERLVKQLPHAKHIHADETGSKENGKRRWTWCFRTKDFTVFHIDKSRGSAVLKKLLGMNYAGMISSDFFSAYRKFKRISKARLQFCWAHLIREVKFLAENVDEKISDWGNRLLEEIRKMFSLYHSRDSLLGDDWRDKMWSCQESILKAACSLVPANKTAENLSNRLRSWQKEYFRFIECNVPPTNNLCEQTIRRVVIDRKITQGTRSDWGNRWCERIWSVISTCEQRGENVMLFLRSCVDSFLQGFSLPAFLANEHPLPSNIVVKTHGMTS